MKKNEYKHENNIYYILIINYTTSTNKNNKDVNL